VGAGTRRCRLLGRQAGPWAGGAGSDPAGVPALAPGFPDRTPTILAGSVGTASRAFTVGVVPLGERPGREVVAGAVGRFWRTAGNEAAPVRTRADFVAFSEPGYAKAAIAFTVFPEREGARVKTETRVVGTSAEATRLFPLLARDPSCKRCDPPELARRDSPARSPGARYDFREHFGPLAVVKLFLGCDAAPRRSGPEQVARKNRIEIAIRDVRRRAPAPVRVGRPKGRALVASQLVVYEPVEVVFRGCRGV